MATRQARTFCRICAAHCGMVLTIEDGTERIVDIKGDKGNPLSQGYVCFKGLQAEEAHHGPARLLRPLKRQDDGTFAEIASEQAGELRTHPGGRIYDHPSAVVLPARPEADGRFDVMPADVAEELRQFLASDLAAQSGPGSGHSHLMISRRMNRVMNSLGNTLAGTLRRDPLNPAYMNPADITALGLAPADRVTLSSEHGSIETVAQPDAAVRAGVISVAHCWGGLPGEDGPGANTNLLIADDRHLAPVNMMPRMSAVPINVSKAG
jgi:anaerobic selenocysteine-containing dehydrogenase